MEENVTREDLRQFGIMLLDRIRSIIAETSPKNSEVSPPEWLKSKSVRQMLDLSAGSVQNLRISQKVRFKKVLGSYYYNREDLLNLFKDEPVAQAQ
ncbi:DNA-binding protein [Flavobacterium sp. fv08]|uniref:DNA-binding protein n=1 Tax=Flavobacterium sp. fv08 TaxID=1761784 RepID=UPI0008BEE779|nr:DNA-binding protein [Flavobacterium sp. fv08]SEP07130.1 hypothetical protein SAMN04487978_4385 [Flavobacterium sp. fv08]